MEELLCQIKNCRICESYLPAGAHPVVAAGTESKLIIIGQAPGRIVNQTGIPWNDKSGDNLRNWLEIDKTSFYNPNLVALVPMGFCYPGTGKHGDLPPRPECAPLWHHQLITQMPKAKLILLVGQYAQNYYLGNNAQKTLTATVKNFKNYLPNYFHYHILHPETISGWQKTNGLHRKYYPN